MKTLHKWLSRCLIAIAFFGATAHAEDIDIFAGTTVENNGLPNVIFVLDNTSNWARLAQQWPDGDEQGVSEVRAISQALEGLTGKLNVGLMEYSTDGNALENEGGYVRFNLQELTSDSLEEIQAILQTIEENITEPEEKRSKGNPYGHLMADFYNYLAGTFQSQGGDGVPGDLADPEGYTTNFSEFKSPLDEGSVCADTFMIFIGNTESSGPNRDDTDNSGYLKELYEAVGDAPDKLWGDNSGEPLYMPEFTTTIDPTVTPIELGLSECYARNERPSPLAACATEEAKEGGACWQPGLPGEEGEAYPNCFCIDEPEPSGCRGQSNKYPVVSAATEIVSTDGRLNGVEFNMDDWAKFLKNHGIPFQVTDDDGTVLSERVPVTTYTIDVFNAAPNAEFSSLLYSTANVSGGRYFQARSEAAILEALEFTIDEIIATSSSFAAVALPLSATNRARSDNDVFIGMFRPAQGKAPRWYGNLKRYQLARFGVDGVPLLADANLEIALSATTGFARECAESFWTSDSGTFWSSLGIDPPAMGACEDDGVNPWSDLPDGPFVEKGGVAQATRQGFLDEDRNILAAADSSLVSIANGSDLVPVTIAYAAAFGGQTILDYLLGDAMGIDEAAPDPNESLRPSIHGDVVHSTPLTLRYDADTVMAFYGANDGFYRAVDTATGSELWAFIAQEHMGKIKRLYNNYKLIAYDGSEAPADPNDYVAKDYFFDGNSGLLPQYNDDGEIAQAWIYPTMRRGGRMVYALDVSDPNDPALLWRHGCPNLDNDTGCTSGFDRIGQTWSTPVGGYIGKDGFPSDPYYAVMFGGGFDDCLNADSRSYSCSSPKGTGVYIRDAQTGAALDFLDTDAPVITNVAPLDIDFDGNIDFAYVADVAGDLYRINFSSLEIPFVDGALKPRSTPLADWDIVKIGSIDDTEGDGPYRRFYNAPVVGAVGPLVVVAIGSGDRERPLEKNYPFAEDVQNRFYMLVDEPAKTFVENPVGDLADDEATTVNLDGDSMLAVVKLADGEPAPVFSRALYDGWYMDIPDRGEQVANPAAIGGGRVFFNTFQPGVVPQGICTPPLGVGTAYSIPIGNPEQTDGETITGEGGFPIPPIIAVVNIPDGLDRLKDRLCTDGASATDCNPYCEDGICYCEGTGCKDICPGGDCGAELTTPDTVCIGCKGFDPIVIDPNVPPLVSPVYFTEDIDRF